MKIIQEMSGVPFSKKKIPLAGLQEFLQFFMYNTQNEKKMHKSTCQMVIKLALCLECWWYRAKENKKYCVILSEESIYMYAYLLATNIIDQAKFFLCQILHWFKQLQHKFMGTVLPSYLKLWPYIRKMIQTHIHVYIICVQNLSHVPASHWW